METTTGTRAPDFHLDALFYQEAGQWVGHCLQLDLVETGDSHDEAQRNLIDVIREHLRFAIENDNLENIFHAAPPDVWKRFFQSELTGTQTITIETDNASPFPPVTLRETSSPRLAAA